MSKELLTAVRQGNTAEVSLLLRDPIKHNPNYIGKAEEGLREAEVAPIPLHCAIHLGYDEIVDLLLKGQADPNLQGNFGNTALHLAIKPNKLAIIKKLLAAGADIGLKDNDGIDAFQSCLNLTSEMVISIPGNHSGYKEILIELHYQKALSEFLLSIKENRLEDVEKYLSETQKVILNYSQQLICEYQITPNDFNEYYGIPVLEASLLETSDMLEMLYTHNANLSISDHNGYNALHYTARAGKIKNMQWLVEHNVPLNSRSLTKTETALHLAVRYEHFEAARFLLACPSIDVELRNVEGMTAEETVRNFAFQRLFNVYYNKNVPAALAWAYAKITANPGLLQPNLDNNAPHQHAALRRHSI